jgi:hypothetical protein
MGRASEPGKTSPRVVPRVGWTEIPRSVSAALTIAIASNLWAAFRGLMNPEWIPPLHWACLAAACAVLLFVGMLRPEYFRLREFRLPGVAVTALAILILSPLPGLVGRHDDRIPRTMVLAIACGVLSLAAVFAAAPKHPVVNRAPIQSERSDWPAPVGVAVVGLVLLPIWVRSLGALPIVELITGRAVGIDIALARFDALSGLSSVPLRLLVGALRNTYLMFAVGWFFADVFLVRRSAAPVPRVRLIGATMTLAIALSYALVTTERAIVGQVGVAAVISVMVALRRPLSAKVVVWLGLLALSFPLVFGLLNSSGSPAAAFASVRRRLFFVPGDVMVEYFLSFPRRRDFLEGASIPKIPRLFGNETFDLSRYIYEVAYQFDDRFTGSANASFLGVGWANFGFVGVIAWSIVTAGALVVLERLLQSFPRRSGAALRGVAVIQAVLLTSADVSRTVLNVAPGFLDMVLLVWIVTVIRRSRWVAPTSLVQDVGMRGRSVRY